MAGHGDNNSRNIPVQVKDVSNVSQVACGSAHTVCVSIDGAIVWSFGSGDNGNLFQMSHINTGTSYIFFYLHHYNIFYFQVNLVMGILTEFISQRLVIFVLWDQGLFSNG